MNSPQIGIQCFSYYLPTDTLDQPVAVVAPSPQFAYCSQVLGDRAPGLLAGLEAVTLVQVFTCLKDEPPSQSSGGHRRFGIQVLAVVGYRP